MKTLRHCALLVVTSTVLLSCDDNEPILDVRTDEGELCLSQSDPTVLQVSVFTEDCYSSSCSEFLEAACTVGLEGMTITIKSTLRVKEWGGTCTNDCVIPLPSCQIEGMAAGEYHLIHGEYKTTITLPLPGSRWSENADSAWGCGS